LLLIIVIYQLGSNVWWKVKIRK